MASTLDKIAALLAHAEGAGTEAERDAYMSKAQEIATTCAIDLEAARQHQADKTKREVPERRTIMFFQRYSTVTRTRPKIARDEDGTPIRREDGYGYVYDGTEEYEAEVRNSKPRSLAFHVGLYGSVARANSVRFDTYQDSSGVIAYGLPSDLDVVEALFASLLVQMTAACDAALKSGEHKTAGNYGQAVHGATFRAGFYRGFYGAIGARLTAARAAAVAASTTTFVGVHADGENGESAGLSGAEIVLRNKEVEVGGFYKATSNARGSYKGSSAGLGYNAGSSSAHGRAAGNRANLGTNKSIANRASVSA
jgi:hypothetical protein